MEYTSENIDQVAEEIVNNMSLEELKAFVYDEIYERLYKQKREAIVVSTIDSLYLSSDVFISILFLLSTTIVILVSGSSLVISYNCFNGTAADPSSSILTEISKSIVSSRSVVLSVVFLFVALIKTQFNIGSVVLVGVAFDNFCRASWSSFLDVENFINLKVFLL